jgi:RNA polymerase sigma factor (sigma-70 family)
VLLSLFITAVALLAVDPEARAQAAQLIKLALGGRASAMRMLTRRLLPVVNARVRAFYARRGGRSLGARDAEDMVQEVWLTLVQDKGRLLRAYDPSRGASLEGYVGLIARRELWRRRVESERLRRGGDVVHTEIDKTPIAAEGTPSPETHTAQRELLRAIRARVHAELAPRGQLVFASLYVDQLSPQEASVRLGVNLQVIYNWQHKIRGLAREMVAA